ncbi:MAG: GntR family transcriptional regulator, partial [Sphingopyxis sp.]
TKHVPPGSWYRSYMDIRLVSPPLTDAGPNDAFGPAKRPPATKTDRAYWSLRRAIVVGDLPEDSALDDGELMSRYDMGRTPIREAIKRLALEEMVIWPPHRTPHVRTTSPSDLAQLYEARHIFELPAARIAAERATIAQLDELTAYCDLFDSAVGGEAMYEAAEHDYDFHLGVAKASHNRFLVDAVGHLNCGSLRLWYHSYIKLGTDRINADHRRILDALLQHDPKAATEVSRDHIQFSHERQLALYGLGSLDRQARTVTGSRPTRPVTRR